MPNQLQMLFQRTNLPAWVALVLCLLLLALAQYKFHQQSAARATQAFNQQADNIVDAISNRLKHHEQILLGAAGLFNASVSVERDEWRAYVERLQLVKNYPGILGVGYSQVMRPAERASQIAKIRAEGFPDFTIHPPGERILYSAVIYLEPFSGRNLAAFGYDMFQEPTRAKALHLTVDKDITSITGKVKLLQETQDNDVQAGFLMYVPVYRKNLPLITPAQRWAALDGYIYIPYRMNDLMYDILGQAGLLLNFSIYDGTSANPDNQMYISENYSTEGRVIHKPSYLTQRTLHTHGHAWRINFSSSPEFEIQFRPTLDLTMLILGGSTTILVFLFISMLTIRNARAAEQTQLLKQRVHEHTNDLRTALDLQTAVLQNAAHTIIATTPEGIITVFNNTAEKLLGYSASEMIGKQTPAILHDPQQMAARAQQFSAELNTTIKPGFEVFVAKTVHGLPNEHEWIVICKNGKRVPVSLSITALRNTHDEITGFLGIAADITDRNATQLALLENTRQMQMVLDNVIDGIITINKLAIIQSFNQSAEKLFGYTAEEVIGKNVNLLMPEPYRSEHNSYLENYHASGIARIIGIGREVEGLRKDGSTFIMDLAVSHSTHQGQPLYVGVVRDITERRRLDKIKNDFVSTASEELRMPLNAISDSLDLISGGALGNLPTQTKQMIDTAHHNLMRLTNLISNLLDMEKLNAGSVQFDLTIQALTPLIEQTLQNIQGYAKEHDVLIRLTTPVDEAVIKADAKRLQQVLTNFLSNAIMVSTKGKQIEVAVRQVGNNVRVEVIDHGPGIASESQHQVFQKFFQINADNSHKNVGAGLGLAISKELIQRMHGEIGFESQPGTGSCFYFELPTLKIPGTHHDTSPARIPGAPRLLVVEDEPDIGKLFAIMLRNNGYNVDVAHNAESAQIHLVQHHYDAVTLDLMLPDQSGINLIRTIRNQPATRNIPIVVISAYSSDGKLAIKGEFEAVDWLEKPVNSQQLIAAIQRALQVSASSKPRVLHVEDDTDLGHIISALGYEMATFDLAETLADARHKLQQTHYDIVVIDIGLPDGSGWELLPDIEALNPRPSIIVLSGKELSDAEKKSVQMALVKSQTSNEIILSTLKRLLGARQISMPT